MTAAEIDAICAAVQEHLDWTEPPDPDLALRVAKDDNKRLRSALLRLEEELSHSLLRLQEHGEAVQDRMIQPLPRWQP